GSGGGEEGGDERWTGRHDDEAWRAQLWNDPHAYRIPRVRTAADRATGDAIERLPDPRLGVEVRRASPIARAGATGEAGAGDRPPGESGGGRARAPPPPVAPRAPPAAAGGGGAGRGGTTAAAGPRRRPPPPVARTHPRRRGGR